jgi:Fungal chitosanase of glycosyl hydrolase group 75
MMTQRSLLFALLLALPSLHDARAQDVPSKDVLADIVRQITVTPAHISFERKTGTADSICGLQPAQMNLSRSGHVAKSFSVLVDKSSGTGAPSTFFVTLKRIAVDADGSGRAYHPDDPLGHGVCQKTASADGKPALNGICPLDAFSSSGTNLYKGSQRLSGEAFTSSWKAIWPKISERSLKSVTLAEAYGHDVPEKFYFFYWHEHGVLALFRDNIIPKDSGGYPCRYDAADGPRNGYFVSSTTLENGTPARADGCAVRRYLDAETVPYVVLPLGGFGQVRVGDIAIVQSKDRTVYAVVGDEGPGTKLGEGSIALTAKLLGKSGDPLLSMKETWALDIAGRPVSLLVLGGTNKSLNGDYSPRNIETVAQQELKRWNGDGDPMTRFEACKAAAPGN